MKSYTQQATPWISTPGRTTRRTFALGDMHGRADLMESMLNLVRDQGQNQEFDVILLGDFVDRGPDSLACLELAQAAQDITSATHVHILPGNHELMMLDVAHGRERDARIWLENGGACLLDEIEHKYDLPTQTYTQIRKALATALPSFWMDYDFENHIYSGDVLFVHAGISTSSPTESFLSKPAKNARLQALEAEHWAWIRYSFLNHIGPWPGETTRLVVHGHTPALTRPIFNINEVQQACLMPGDTYRVCLDGGAMSLDQGLVGEFNEGQARVWGLWQETGWLP